MEKLKRWYIGKEDKKYKWIKLDVSINPLIIKHLFNFFFEKAERKDIKIETLIKMKERMKKLQKMKESKKKWKMK